MDRRLLSKIILLIKKKMLKGEEIGNLKVSALYSLGEQLTAILYYIGHEIGSSLKLEKIDNPTEISEELIKSIKKYHLGKGEIINDTDELITLGLSEHSSIKDLIQEDIDSKQSFCSFEAGLLAGIVEKISGFHCYAQETDCQLQTDNNYCEFIIVFQRDIDD